MKALCHSSTFKVSSHSSDIPYLCSTLCTAVKFQSSTTVQRESPISWWRLWNFLVFQAKFDRFLYPKSGRVGGRAINHPVFRKFNPLSQKSKLKNVKNQVILRILLPSPVLHCPVFNTLQRPPLAVSQWKKTGNKFTSGLKKFQPPESIFFILLA